MQEAFWDTCATKQELYLLEKWEFIAGVASVIGMLLIIFHSVYFGPALMADAPWVSEYTYFENLEDYEGVEVYLFAFVESIEGDVVVFENVLGEKVEIALENVEGVSQGTPAIISSFYSGGEFSGRVRYLPTHSAERVLVSAIALVVLVIYYFIVKKKLKLDFRNMKVIVQEGGGDA